MFSSAFSASSYSNSHHHSNYFCGPSSYLDLFFLEFVEENSTIFSGISVSIFTLELQFERKKVGKEYN